MKNKSIKKKCIEYAIVSIICIIICLLCFKSCGSTDPCKLIFKNSPYVEYSPLTTSDWESFDFGIKKDGSYYFEFTQHKYSVNNRAFTDVNFGRVEGTWEFVGKFEQKYKVYKTNARLASVSKSQSFAIYKLNGLVGGFYAEVADDGTVTQNVYSYQGYCVYRYGGTNSWSLGNPEGICIFFTNETIDEEFLNNSVDSESLSTGWGYGSIGEYNYTHTVKI